MRLFIILITLLIGAALFGLIWTDKIGLVLDLFFHLDIYLSEAIALFGPWIYLLLFVIIFCETGLVVTPFLPGDSLIFALGALAALEGAVIELKWLVLILIGAAILGDAVNYAIGRQIGPKVFKGDRRWLKKKHLLETEAFYERHGGKTIILARFLPIIRTFAPFVAGIGQMTYSRFAVFNITGALLWVGSMLLSGTLFGNIPIIQKNFEFVVVGIILVSCLPLIIRIARKSTPLSPSP